MGPITSATTQRANLIAELEAIGRSVSFQAGERVITEGEPGDGVYILRSGSARVSMTAHDGETIQLRELGCGAFIGLSSTLSCDHSCYTVETAEAAAFTFIPVDKACEFLRQRTDLCLQVMQVLGQEMSAVCHERAILNARSQPVRIP